MKKIFTMCISAMLLLATTGCSLNKIELESQMNESDSNDEEYYGRKEIECPGGTGYKKVVRSDDGGIYLLTGEGYGLDKVWYLDENENWEFKYDVKKILELDEDDYCDVSLSPTGETLAVVQVDGEGETEYLEGEKKYFYIDEKGNINDFVLDDLPEVGDSVKSIYNKFYGKKLELKNYLSDFVFNDGYGYGLDFNGNIYQVEVNEGVTKMIYDISKSEYSDGVESFAIADDMLILNKGTAFEYQGIKDMTHEKTMNDNVSPFLNKIYDITSPLILDANGNDIWAITSSKIGCYDLENNEEKIVRAVGYSGDERILNAAVSNDCVYIVTTKSIGTSEEYTLYKYEKKYNGEEAKTENEEVAGNLTIWTLKGNPYIEEAVKVFSNEYPSVDIKIEVGLSHENGITENDVIKNLNTEILAGNGPDIIYMDGMNINSYIESGNLYDLSTLVTDMEKTEKYYNNILDTFKSDKGIYAIPSSMYFCAKLGKPEAVNESGDMASFVDYLQKRDDYYNVVKSDYISDYIVNYYYKDIIPYIKGCDLDYDKLDSFFENSKKIAELYNCKDMQIDANYFLYSNEDYLFDGKQELILSYVQGIEQMSIFAEDIVSKTDGIYQVVAKDFEHTYFVNNCITINKNSANIDAACKYIETAISAECQGNIYGSMAFPVNKDALKKREEMRFNTFSEQYVTDKIFATSTDALYEHEEELDEIIAQMNDPIFIDVGCDSIIFTVLTSYINGQINKDEAVKSAMDKIKIYLEE